MLFFFYTNDFCLQDFGPNGLPQKNSRIRRKGLKDGERSFLVENSEPVKGGMESSRQDGSDMNFEIKQEISANKSRF